MNNVIQTMNPDAINKVYALETHALKLNQVNIETSHVLHARMYARTIMIPDGVLLTGALIKIPTIVILQGDLLVYTGDECVEMVGYNVISACEMRKQAFVARADSYITMIFPTDAKTVEDAENEFTDESDMLLSRKQLKISGE